MLVVIFLLAFDFCRFCVVILFFIPSTTANDLRLRFLFQMLSITFLSYLNFLRKSQYFPFQCCVLNKGTTGTIFITSLSWRGPWLGIEPGTSRTRSHHSTTRLSRWQCLLSLNVNFINFIVILRTFYSFPKAGVIIFTKHV